jgi:transcriptional regulator with XRE-family HTH domain
VEKSSYFNLRLRTERERRGWTREHVAELVEASDYTVSQWERGKQFPRPYHIKRLCELFDMNAEELGLIREEAKNKQPPHLMPESFEKLSTKLYDYDVALSYAGENRDCAAALANILNRRGVKVFYDQYEKPVLWGKDLYTHLSDVYSKKACYCVVFISQYYANKVWTKHELKAAQDRALNENKEYILPIRLDNTEIPGILSTTAYLSWPPETVETIADAIMEKLGKINKSQKDFDSENPDNYYSGL